MMSSRQELRLRKRRRKARDQDPGLNTDTSPLSQESTDVLIDFSHHFGVSKGDALYLNQKSHLIRSKVSEAEVLLRKCQQSISKKNEITRKDAENILLSSGLRDLLELDGNNLLETLDDRTQSVSFEVWLRYIITVLRKIYSMQYLDKKSKRRLIYHPENVSDLAASTAVINSEKASLASSQLKLSSPIPLLPPLRISSQAKSTKAIPATMRKVFAEAGFDESLGRDTPRCLRAGEGQFTIAELRRELKIAEAGLAQLTDQVDGNIAWVQQNCSYTASKGRPSSLVRSKCHELGAKKLAAVVEGFLSSTRVWALLRWRSASRHLQISQSSVAFLKAKSLDMLVRISRRILRNNYSRAFQPWRTNARQQVREERLAAALHRGCEPVGYSTMCRSRVQRESFR